MYDTLINDWEYDTRSIWIFNNQEKILVYNI